MSKLSVNSLDSKVIGEMEEVTQDRAIEAEIGADLDGFDVNVVRTRDTIGRFYGSGVPGYVLVNRFVDRAEIEKVQRLITGKLGTDTAKLTMAEICSGAEAMKNLVNASVASDLAALKAVEILGFKGKKRNRQSNAPQAVITGANPQVVVSAEGIAVKSDAP